MNKSVFETERLEAIEAERCVAASVDDEIHALLNSDTVCREIGRVPVTVGKNVKARLTSVLSEFTPSQQIAVLYIDDISPLGREISVALNSSGYRVFELSVPKNSSLKEQCLLADKIPDYIKFVFGLGSGRVAEICALLSSRRNIDFGLFATAPSTDYLLNAVKMPKCVIADTEVLDACPKNLVAAGAGILLSQPLRQFERKVESLLYETAYAAADKQNAKKLNKLLIAQGENIDRKELFWQLMELSEANRKNSFVSSAEILADILSRADGTRSIGEYEFIASYLLAGFYSCYLSNKCTDVLLPPDKVKTMKLLEKKCGFDYFYLIKRIDILTANSYFRIKYIVDEYRADLQKEINDLDLVSAQKFWRRQYADAGFWLSKTFSAKELMSLLALSGELAGGLLGYAKESGALENYI